MILTILQAEIINLLGVDSRTDYLCYRIETTGVYDTTLADAFYLFWSFNQVTGNEEAVELVEQIVQEVYEAG